MRYEAREFYLKSRRKWRNSFEEVPESITNTFAVAEMCDVKLPFGENNYPVFTLPPEIKTEVKTMFSTSRIFASKDCIKDTRLLIRKSMIARIKILAPKNLVKGWITSWV